MKQVLKMSTTRTMFRICDKRSICRQHIFFCTRPQPPSSESVVTMKVVGYLLLVSGLIQVQCALDVPEEDIAADSPTTRQEQSSIAKPKLHQSSRALQRNTERVLVKYYNEQGKQQVLARSSRMYHQFTKKNVMAVEIDVRNLRKLRRNANIASIEQDRIYEEQGFHEYTLTEEEQSHRKLQQTMPYGISMVQADQLNVGRYPVAVCIADTGVAKKHPDLPKGLLKGADRRSNITNMRLRWRKDRRGHGTHVAGTITAKDNGFGVRGIGKIPIFVTRALDDSGQARESDVYEAVEQCTKSNARIVSMSLGGGGMSQTFKDLLTSLYDNNGFLLVGASGNNGANTVSWPAAHPRVIGVGAVQDDRSIWPASNYGSQVELSAPGKMILSTTINAAGSYVYSFYSGTSMATPHVAGVAALVWSHFPQCTNTQIRYALTRTALDGGASSCDSRYGWGIVQAKNAYNWLLRNPCASASWGQSSEPQGGCT
ncbi:hypothetical protein MPSEU_000191500 [Mayamaea pseudoterrestris]|nr:hypothetical protein MPSEU_000191500 [Mayamaea pseudoterrestris]